jgi:hypothetical protein
VRLIDNSGRCKRGHVLSKVGVRQYFDNRAGKYYPCCVACGRESGARYRTTNAERVRKLRREGSRRRYAANPEKFTARDRKYKAEHHEQTVAIRRRYYEKNRSKLKQYRREYLESKRRPCPVCETPSLYGLCGQCSRMCKSLFGKDCNTSEVAVNITQDLKERYQWLKQNKLAMKRARQQFLTTGSVRLKNLDDLFKSLESIVLNPKPKQSEQSTGSRRTNRK